jgi:hypothetical protein
MTVCERTGPSCVDIGTLVRRSLTPSSAHSRRGSILYRHPLMQGQMECEECGVRVTRTGKVRASVCGCGKVLCPKHAHYYIDGSGYGFMRNVPPMCSEHLAAFENRHRVPFSY